MTGTCLVHVMHGFKCTQCGRASRDIAAAGELSVEAMTQRPQPTDEEITAAVAAKVNGPPVMTGKRVVEVQPEPTWQTVPTLWGDHEYEPAHSPSCRCGMCEAGRAADGLKLLGGCCALVVFWLLIGTVISWWVLTPIWK